MIVNRASLVSVEQVESLLDLLLLFFGELGALTTLGYLARNHLISTELLLPGVVRFLVVHFSQTKEFNFMITNLNFKQNRKKREIEIN